MNLKHRGVLAPLCALALAPAAAQAATQTYQCAMGHFVRAGGTEMASTSISVRNADPANAATILRLTIRDGEGQVVHDSGPLATAPLPLNTDFPVTFPGGKDITQVPPGGAVYLRSNHIWGNGPLPGAAGNETGQFMTASVVVTKEGPKSALSVHATPRFRTRTPGPTPGLFVEGDTRATGNGTCETTP